MFLGVRSFMKLKPKQRVKLSAHQGTQYLRFKKAQHMRERVADYVRSVARFYEGLSQLKKVYICSFIERESVTRPSLIILYHIVNQMLREEVQKQRYEYRFTMYFIPLAAAMYKTPESDRWSRNDVRKGSMVHRSRNGNDVIYQTIGKEIKKY